jgi:hypothetical protein
MFDWLMIILNESGLDMMLWFKLVEWWFKVDCDFSLNFDELFKFSWIDMMMVI